MNRSSHQSSHLQYSQIQQQQHSVSGANLNLNFQVIPTAQGPKIIQKGVTVKPGALDNIFTQIKYQSIPRPVSARARHDSFHSSQSWDGAAHLRYSAFKIGQNRGDRPGLGRHYNPTRQRRRGSHRNCSNHSRRENNSLSCSHPSLEEHPIDHRPANGKNNNQPELNVSNVDTQRDSTLDHPFMRIDAQSQTDPGENNHAENNHQHYQHIADHLSGDSGDGIRGHGGRGRRFGSRRDGENNSLQSAAYNASSLSPEREDKPTSNVHQYTIPRRPGGGATGLLTAALSESKTTPVRHQELQILVPNAKSGNQQLQQPSNNVRNNFNGGISGVNTAGGAANFAGINSIMDPGCSTIEKAAYYDGDHRVPEDQDHPDLSASFSKDAGQFCKEYYSNQQLVREDQQLKKGAVLEAANSTQDLVNFKQKLNENRIQSWTEEEINKGSLDTMSFAPVVGGAGSTSSKNMVGTGPGAKVALHHSSINSSQQSPPLGTTPFFEPSNKSNTMHNDRATLALENNDSVKQQQLMTQRQSYANQQTNIPAGIHEQFAQSTMAFARRAGAQSNDDYFYNLDNQVGLFTDRAGQTSSTREGLMGTGQAISGTGQPGDLQQMSQQPHQLNMNQQYRRDSLAGATQGETCQTFPPQQPPTNQFPNKPGFNKQDSTTSQLVWQASIQGAALESTDDLKVVSEEVSHQDASKHSTPMDKIEDAAKKGPTTQKTTLGSGATLMQKKGSNSTLNTSRPGSAKNNHKQNMKSSTGKKPTLLMSAKKGGAKKKPLGAIMMPPAGKSMTGRLSPTTMKIESVKSMPSGLKTGSTPKMVLKSNVAMAAELPKSLAPPKTGTNKKGSAERVNSKKKTTSGAASTRAGKVATVALPSTQNTTKGDIHKQVSGSDATTFEIDLRTQVSNNVASPPSTNLDIYQPDKSAEEMADPQNSKKKKQGGAKATLKPIPVNEICLVSATLPPAMVPTKSAPPKTSNIDEATKSKGTDYVDGEELKIEVAQSEYTPHQTMDEISPAMGRGLGETKMRPNASQSFIQNNTIDINDQSSPIILLNVAKGGSAKKARRNKGERTGKAGGVTTTSRNNYDFSSVGSSRSPMKSTRTDQHRELQVLEIPKEYDMESDHVVEYMLGDKAIEIEAPLYQLNISNKLVYQLSQLNGDDPPPFIRLVENKLGRKVIRIRQKETTGVQQLYQFKLDVRNPETNVSGQYKCRVFVRPGVKLLLKKSLFTSPVEYSIKGPAKILQMPVYSAKHDDLDFYIERCGDEGDLPNFIRVSRDSDGNRVIKLQGTHINEIGIYELQLIARDKITRVLNDEFTFTVIGTPGIEVKHLPKEYEEEIKVDPSKSCIQLAMPTFNLETVKEEEAMPIEYSLVMKDGTKVPEFIFIKTLDDGDHIIELKAADLPPGLNTVFEVQLKVYDPNVDATQLIPISVKCPEPNLMLTLKPSNFPEEINYTIGSKEILIKVPVYNRNDGQELQDHVLLSLGGKESTTVSRIAQIYTSESGEQFIRVQTFDQKLKGTYEVKVYATEQNSGLTNQDAIFRLNVQESVLTLTETPNVCFLGKPLLYQPKGPPTYVPLPQYVIQRAQIQFTLTSCDENVGVPPFVRIQGDYMVIEGIQNPTTRDYNLKLVAFDPVSESKHELEVQITSNIYQILLDRVPFNSPVEFKLGDELTLPMPIYREEPFSGELAYELEIQGAGMMLAGIELASIMYTENGQPIIKIAGGKNSQKGTYQITVCASEKTLNVSNKEAIFMLEAKPQLKLVKRPAEFDQMPPMQVDQVYKLPLPTFATKKRLRYQIQEKGTDDEQSCPSFITVKCPKQAQPYIEIKCLQQLANGIPTKPRYDLELITCENQRHNVENVQEFSLQFDIQPRMDLKLFSVSGPIRYCVGQGPLTLPLPLYECYIADIRNMDISLISDFTGRPVPFATVDRANEQIVINTEKWGFEGLHDISVMVSSDSLHTNSQGALRNDQAKFRLEITAIQEAPSGAQSPNRGNHERSSETIHHQDSGGSGIMMMHQVMVQAPGQSQGVGGENNNHEIIDEKISKIEENEEIPIYYSDQSIDDKLPITPRNEESSQNNHNQARQQNKLRQDNSTRRNHENGNRNRGPTEGTSPRERAGQVVHGRRDQCVDDDGEIVVTADEAIQITGNAPPNRGSDAHRGDHNGMLMLDEAVAAVAANSVQQHLPKEQIDMLMRENEEIRRQIAEVRNQMDQSMQMAARSVNGAGNQRNNNDTSSQQPLSPIRASQQNLQQQSQNLGQQQQQQQQQNQQQNPMLNSPEALVAASQQLHASMQLLNQSVNHHQQQNQHHQSLNLAGLLANSLDEAYLQEEAIMNNQLKQRIEQSKLRQMQQMSELERMRNEVNQGQTSHQQQLLNHYLTETNGQGREKDVRLRQLRTQLAQLQEQRASLRKQCTTLKQKEDDFQSDLIMKDQQLKQLTKRNEEQSTKATSVFSEIDKVCYRNENLRAEVQALEEQLEDKKQIVNRNKAKLRDLNGTQSELEDKITSQKHRFNKLRVEMESVKRRLDHEESMAQAAAVHNKTENLHTATFSPQIANEAKLLEQLRQSQLVMHQQMPNEMPDQIHGGVGVDNMAGGYHSHPAGGNNLQPQMSANSFGAPQPPAYHHQHERGYNPITGMPNNTFQPQDLNDMPAAGVPTQRRAQNSSGGAMPAMAMTPQRQPHQYVPSYHRNGPMHQSQQFYPAGGSGSSEKKVTNPRPQRPIRPVENNIFGSQSDHHVSSGAIQSNHDLSDSQRFQTTYTQFANREKFRGSREGEDGGLRINQGYPSGGYGRVPMQQMYQQHHPGGGMVQPPPQHVEQASGMTTDRRRQRELQNAALVPHSNRDFHNYEKKYRY